MLGPPLVRPRTGDGIAPELDHRARLGRRPAGRDRRQGVARPQLRPDAGQPRHRLDGLYRVVRHPIYLGYLVTHVAFVVANPIALEPAAAGGCRHRRCWRARSARSGRWRTTMPIGEYQQRFAGASCRACSEPRPVLARAGWSPEPAWRPSPRGGSPGASQNASTSGWRSSDGLHDAALHAAAAAVNQPHLAEPGGCRGGDELLDHRRRCRAAGRRADRACPRSGAGPRRP